MKLVVIGAGLIGTSIALGAKKIGAEVELLDEDGRAQALANDLVEARFLKALVLVPR